VASMSMTSHPARVLPAMASHGNPAGVASMSFQARSLAFARALATRSSMAGAPARSRARRTVGPLGASPRTGARWASRAMSLMLVAPSAIATASDASTVPRSSSGAVPFLSRAALSAAVSPSWSAALRSRMAPAWPTSPFPPAVTFRAWSHPLCCMAKSAPGWKLRACGNRESPRPRALFALKAARDGRFAAVPCHSRDQRPARTNKVRPSPARYAVKPQLTPTGMPPCLSVRLQR
jgi:hypothetical protein